MIQPFQISIPQQQLDDLKQRLEQAKLPSPQTDEPWKLGADQTFIRKLIMYWQQEYDWRKQEQFLNQFPQYIAQIDGFAIHFLHIKGERDGATPLLITHGWPGSFIEHLGLIPYLTQPSQHGGTADQAFDVIIPSLPGFGFSSVPNESGTHAQKVAHLWAQLMEQLGYERYVIQGGDIGAMVSTWMSLLYPERVQGLHLNFIPTSYQPPLGDNDPPLTVAEQRYLEEAQQFMMREGAYAALHRTKPETIAFALSDSPIGLAAWLGEKFYSWTDHDGNLEDAVSLDTLLTNISIYWFTNTIASSMRIYAEGTKVPLTFATGEKLTVPTGVSAFPKELLSPPRSWAERAFPIVRWEQLEHGGHFAALEQPLVFAEQVRNFVYDTLKI